ncbi:MAG: hypothetical protein ACRDOU_02985 [Streptosporangiaceae bacterium]
MTALTIQDVSRRSGLSEPTLRYYEEVAPTQEEPGDELPNLVIHNDRAKSLFGWKPRPLETTIVETAESLRDLGLLEAGQSM